MKEIQFSSRTRAATDAFKRAQKLRATFNELLAMMPEALPGQRVMASIGWAALSAAVFSGWHYVGQFGEPFELRSFVFRWVCGVVFTLIYVFRGFAPVVWTHALYDIWVLAF